MRELYRYRDLIWTLVQRDLKVRYRRSAIGFLWTMLQPLLMLLVLNIVFRQLFRFEVKNYPVYVLAGLLFWNFFQQTIVSSMKSLKGNAIILKKLPVPLAVFPIATVISGLVNLSFAFVPLFAILLATGHPVTPALLFLPVAILVAAIFTLGAGLILSPLAVFFSDVIELVTVVMLMLFYLTPVIYPKSIAADTDFFWAVRFNPIRSILEIFRDPIYYGKLPPLDHFSLSLVIAVVLLAIGVVAFRKSSDRIPFYL